MSIHWHDTKAAIEAELDRIMWDEPEEVTMSRLGVYPGGPGTRNQYLSNLFFQVADTQAMSWWTAEPAMWLALDDPDLSVDACKKFWTYMTVHMAHLMGDVDSPKCPQPWLNLSSLTNLCQQVLDSLPSVETKEDLRELLWSWFAYMHRLNTWFFMVFPWELGEQFPLKSREEVEELVKNGTLSLPAEVVTTGNWKNGRTPSAT